VNSVHNERIASTKTQWWTGIKKNNQHKKKGMQLRPEEMNVTGKVK